MRTRALLLTLLAVAPLQLTHTQSAAPERAFRFAVLGHVRGGKDGPNPKLAELLDAVRKIKPAFVVLTGDMIWGDIEHNPADTAWLVREWTHLDSALATLGVPAYRVPGNHDINDLASRDVYLRRYGRPPTSVTYNGTQLLLLSSAYIPPDSDTRKMPMIRTRSLEPAQVRWLRTELAKPGPAHRFVFMHHLLWWEPDSSSWWREVHPLLSASHVDAVFSGDYGPMKFSTRTQDGVRYYQTSMEGKPSMTMLRNNLGARMLSSQFDNFLEVDVDGAQSRVVVHTLAEESSGFFTPQHYAEVTAPAPPQPFVRRVWEKVGTPRRMALLLAGLGAVFALGWVAGRMFAARRIT